MQEQSVEEIFGRQVAHYRQERAWSQRDLIERVAKEGLILDTSAISRIESGRRALRLSEAVSISKAFGIRLGTMLSQEVADAIERNRLLNRLDVLRPATERTLRSMTQAVVDLWDFCSEDAGNLESVNAQLDMHAKNATEVIEELCQRWFQLRFDERGLIVAQAADEINVALRDWLVPIAVDPALVADNADYQWQFDRRLHPSVFRRYASSEEKDV